MYYGGGFKLHGRINAINASAGSRFQGREKAVTVRRKKKTFEKVDNAKADWSDGNPERRTRAIFGVVDHYRRG